MSDGKLVQIADARREKQEALRREYERVLFKHMLGCYTVIEKLGLKSVEILDISKSGCSFQMPLEAGSFDIGEVIDFRFYFSNATYLPCKLTVKRANKVSDNFNQYMQYGCVFDQSLSTYKAIDKFVEFVTSYSESAKEDKGESQVWYL